jgi:hypothetical protein
MHREMLTVLTTAEVKTVLTFVSRVAQPRFLTRRDRDAVAQFVSIVSILRFTPLCDFKQNPLHSVTGN